MTEAPTHTFNEYVLAHLRVTRLHLRLALNAVDAAGLALKAGWLSPDDALAELVDMGLLADITTDAEAA